MAGQNDDGVLFSLNHSPDVGHLAPAQRGHGMKGMSLNLQPVRLELPRDVAADFLLGFAAGRVGTVADDLFYMAHHLFSVHTTHLCGGVQTGKAE